MFSRYFRVDQNKSDDDKLKSTDYPLLENSAVARILVSVTFDDGDEVLYDKYYPVLQEYGIKATFYVVTGLIGKPGWMTWDELKDLYDNRHEIGSHSHTHPHLTDLCALELDFELSRSKELLEQFGCETLAYPYGEYDSRVISFARQYYRAARGYYDLSRKGRAYGLNFWQHNERYALKTFPTEIIFPSQSTPLLNLPIDMLRDSLEAIIRQGIEKNAWAIFVFHGRPNLSSNISTYLRRWPNAATKSAKYLRGVVDDLFLAKHLAKFKLICSLLSRDDRLRILTVAEALKGRSPATAIG